MSDKISTAEAFYYLGELIEHIEKQAFDKKYIQSLNIARNALVAIELLGIATTNKSSQD